MKIIFDYKFKKIPVQSVILPPQYSYIVGGKNTAGVAVNRFYKFENSAYATLSDYPINIWSPAFFSKDNIEYVIGGYTGSHQKSCRKYTTSWILLNDWIRNQCLVRGNLIDTSSYIMGGWDGTSTYNDMNVYDITTDSTSTKSATFYKNSWDYDSDINNNNVYYYSTADVKTTKYDVSSDLYETKTDALISKEIGAGFSKNNIYYGFSSKNVGSDCNSQKYDYSSNTWSTFANQPISLGRIRGASNNLSFGGRSSDSDSDSTDYTFSYAESNDTWKSETNYPLKIHFTTAI